MQYRSRAITLLKREIVDAEEAECVTINTNNIWPDSDIDNSKRKYHFMGATNKK
jgi:hypothetical protein